MPADAIISILSSLYDFSQIEQLLFYDINEASFFMSILKKVKIHSLPALR